MFNSTFNLTQEDPLEKQNLFNSNVTRYKTSRQIFMPKLNVLDQTAMVYATIQ